MNWLIPAKTFLLGEYSALAQGSALVLTTAPYFQLTLSNKPELVGIHPQSPAGLWWQHHHKEQGLVWQDPYNGQGGLGASSAQFLGAYLASSYLQNQAVNLNELLKAYYESSWSGKGLKPSGYDVIAQSQGACVFINKQKNIIQSYPWVFSELSFTLIHTGKKLATHHHLEDNVLPDQTHCLSELVDNAHRAFIQQHSDGLISAINAFHQKLIELNLVANHSIDLINELKNYPEVLAIKGCGAMGADVVLVVTSQQDAPTLREKCLKQDRLIVATEKNLTECKREDDQEKIHPIPRKH